MAAGLARFHAAGAKVHANGPMDQVLHAAQMVMDYAEAARSFLLGMLLQANGRAPEESGWQE